MVDRAFERYSRRMYDLIVKLEQIGLSSREVVRIVKGLNNGEGNSSITSWFSRRRDRALRIRDVFLAGAFVIFIGIAGMLVTLNGAPGGDIGLSAFITSAALLICCIIATLYYLNKANSIDRRLDQVHPILASYRKSS